MAPMKHVGKMISQSTGLSSIAKKKQVMNGNRATPVRKKGGRGKPEGRKPFKPYKGGRTER